ncbi:hypothetical protein PSA7680_01119 [Pseudoruegeria aquimaris]|uniref:Lysozyme inhibitor LprI N-terminal domain-containing protein n=1 Tax=Pseudoruegeria aquimaris TaxID=393663 RepID=A0A1Y5RVC4_9RHOB|nr:hypothetical protein [Pseudoruegeria aquimaris]SLN25905.1 hypothetical protein PSA7680_01119 [Pseudoruegeria aquimaris]
MGIARTSLVSAVLVLLARATPAPAFQATPDQQLRFFATCAGRLSAQMEHQWMFDGAASEITMAHRDSVIDILDALMPPERGRDVLAMRIEAKMAHAALLTRATFNDDTEDAAWAKATAVRLAAECEALLLG